MKSKVLLTVAIVFVMLLFVLANITFANEKENAVSVANDLLSSDSFGIYESAVCFAAGSIAYILKIGLDK
jgi:hypothetical protein